MTYNVTLIILGVLIVIVISMIIIISNLSAKNKALVLEIENMGNLEEESYNFFYTILKKHLLIHQQLERIDAKGSFRVDDEVGFIYRNIKKTIEELHEYLDMLRIQLKDENEQ